VHQNKSQEISNNYNNHSNYTFLIQCYKIYKCPQCGTKKYVPFTCKSRLCTFCGTKAANEWAGRIHHILLKVPHRHVVFTVSDKLRELLKNPKYQKVLFAASKITMEEMVASSNKKSKNKTKLKIGPGIANLWG
jgi:hypothetical protein